MRKHWSVWFISLNIWSLVPLIFLQILWFDSSSQLNKTSLCTYTICSLLIFLLMSILSSFAFWFIYCSNKYWCWSSVWYVDLEFIQYIFGRENCNFSFASLWWQNREQFLFFQMFSGQWYLFSWEPCIQFTCPLIDGLHGFLLYYNF